MKKLQGNNNLRERNRSNPKVLKESINGRKRSLPSDSDKVAVKRTKKSEINGNSNIRENNKTKTQAEVTNPKKTFHTFNSKDKKSKKIIIDNGEKVSRKDIRKQFLDLKDKRKRKEITHYEVITKAKKMWEELRQEKCPVSKRAKLLAALFDLLKDKLDSFAFQHDTSRILQWLLKLGTHSIRLSICESLKPLFRKMLLTKYSRFCVKTLVKYGDKSCREIVFSELQGHIVKLMSSSVSAPVVEYMYSSFGTASQIKQFKNEFYGEMFKLFGSGEGDEAKSSHNIAKDVRADTKANLLQVISKRVPTSQVMHSIILEFLKVCESGDRDEIIDALYLHPDVLVKTKEGAEILMRCCWFTSGKTRKAILKSIKGRVKEFCEATHGYLFLMALLDSVDDTVLLRKTVLQELLTNVNEILFLGNGWKVIAYLVAYRDSHYFHPDLLSLLKTADTSEFIKKDVDIKRAEILETVMGHLAKSIAQDASPWFRRPSLAMVLRSILKVAKGDIWVDAIKTISLYICKNNPITKDNKTLPLIEHSCYHLAIVKMIQNEDEEGKTNLSYELAVNLTEEIIWKWLKCNRGCFLLTAILESTNKIAVKTLSKKITKEMKKYVTKKELPGEIALDKKLSVVNIM